MQNKELDTLFEYINEVVRQIRDLQDENFEAGIVDSVMSNCENLFNSYEVILDNMEIIEYKVEREVDREKWNPVQLDDLYTDIKNWKLPDNLEIDEEDKRWLKITINNFADDLENILDSLYSN